VAAVRVDDDGKGDGRRCYAAAFLRLASGRRSTRATPRSTSGWLRPFSPQNCVKQGGTLTIERRPDGGQYGICVFTDNYQCEEWALFRGECPKNGLRVTGYVTPAGRYCAITGGRYTVVTESAAGETGVCSLPGGKTCGAAAYYAGNCSR
jgi:putative hemolysin